MQDAPQHIQPWYREPWPWILMAGPAAVVVAGAVTIWLAFATADGLVTDDYYRRGLAINQELRRDQAALERGIAAEVERDGGMLRVRLRLRDAPPSALFARLLHATRAGHDQRLRLAAVAPGVYEAELPALPAVSAYVDGPEGWSIGYSKLDGKWRLVAGRAETGTIKLTAAPRLVRIAALGMQDQIIQALIDRTVECLNSIEAARK